MSEATEVTVTLRAIVASATEAMDSISRAIREFGARSAITAAAARQMVRAFRRFNRQRITSGHRHRGTRDWTLRYAPARKDVPLGLRTIAKAQDAAFR